MPTDNITGVAVRDSLPAGVIRVAGLQGIAFWKLNGFPSSGWGSSLTVLRQLLGSNAAILPATDVYLFASRDYTHCGQT